MAWQDWPTSNVVSKLNVNDNDYVIKDKIAQDNVDYLKEAIEALNGKVLYFRGITTTAIFDGDTEHRTIQIDGKSYTAENGDVVIYQHNDTLADTKEEEYVWIETNSSTHAGRWQEFGSTGALKALAFKDTASGSYTPDGTVSQPTFSGTQGSLSVTGTPSGTIAPITATGTGDYTPAGTVSQPDVDVNTTTASGYLVTKNGTAPTLTKNSAPTTDVISSATYANETLTFASAVFAPGSAPTLEKSPSALTGVTAGLHEAPAFTGTATGFAFTGSSTTSTGTFTPEGTVSQPTFSGTADTITVS